MKFYLSSYKLGNESQKLKTLLPSESRRIGYISNALDWSADLGRRARTEQFDMEQLRTLAPDLTVEKLDLRDFFHAPGVLKQALVGFGTIWVCGGNSFVLRQAMRLSGFDCALKEFVSDGVNMLYGGYSAGICVLGPTLKGIDIMDDAFEQPYGEHETIWDGLGIVEYTIVPHFQSDHPEAAAADRALAYMQGVGVAVRPLRDGEVIIIP